MAELRGHGGAALWIAWERHRRSRELAGALGVPLYTFLGGEPYAWRVLSLSLRTLVLLARTRPRTVIVQNPSMVLAAVACMARRALGYRLVVDRHSNFRLEESENRAPKWRAFHSVSRYTIRAADLTIVTNEALRTLVDAQGGRALVLPDRIPAMTLAVPEALSARPNVVFICSHGDDEPVVEVLQAAKLLPDVQIHITGDASTTRRRLGEEIPRNVRLTGYLPEPAYQSLLASCDVVLSLTSAPNTLLCGAYEAVALGKPLVVSDQKALTSYFSRGTVATANTPEGLAAAIRQALADLPRLSEEMTRLREERSREWNTSFARLVDAVESLPRAGG